MKFKQIIDEGIYDPAIFKAIFLSGGPGSGKSYIAKKLSLKSLGFSILNSDRMFEYMAKINNLSLKMPENEKEIRDIIRKKAKKITINNEELILKGRLGLVIDGTAWNISKIELMKQKLENIGYETAMVFINTNVETAMERNKKRDRTVPDDIVITRHKQVQENLGKFQQLFEDHFYLIDNSDGIDNKDRINKIYKIISKWAKILPKNKLIGQWISYEKKRKMKKYEL